MTDPIWEVQAFIDDNLSTNQSPAGKIKSVLTGGLKTKKNPKGMGGGEVSPKPPHLEMELAFIFPLIVLMAVVLAFFAGFLLGRSTVNSRLLSVVEQAENSLQIVLSQNGARLQGKVKAAVIDEPAEVAAKLADVSESSILKAPTPQEARRRRQKEIDEAAFAEQISITHSGGSFHPTSL